MEITGYSSKIIAYTGTHGTGKTTAVLQTALRLKLEHPGATVGWVTEVARLSPWPINHASPPHGQAWIFATHMARELEACAQCDHVVADRTVVDAIAYTRALGYDDLASAMAAMAAPHLAVYRQIVLMLCSRPYCFDDGQRDANDEVFRRAVERNLIRLYQQLGVWGRVTIRTD